MILPHIFHHEALKKLKLLTISNYCAVLSHSVQLVVKLIEENKVGFEARILYSITNVDLN